MTTKGGLAPSMVFFLKVGLATITLLAGIAVAVIVGFLVAIALVRLDPSPLLPVFTIGGSFTVVIVAYLWFIAKLCQRTTARYNLPIPVSGLAFPMVNVWLVVAALRFNER